tara:strand:- start:73 stop:246 length:174 start_codon:yes stop_codon:yes gene_type:complete
MKKEMKTTIWSLASLIFILFLGFSVTGLAQDKIWMRKSDMPISANGIGTGLIDGKWE